jgi:hypothetical protein
MKGEASRRCARRELFVPALNDDADDFVNLNARKLRSEAGSAVGGVGGASAAGADGGAAGVTVGAGEADERDTVRLRVA